MKRMPMILLVLQLALCIFANIAASAPRGGMKPRKPRKPTWQTTSNLITTSTLQTKNKIQRIICPLDRSNFKILKKSGYLIDKTKYIEIVWNDNDFSLFSCAKRFGKSLFLDMLKTFFELEIDQTGKQIYPSFKEKQNSANFEAFKNTEIFYDKNGEFNQAFFEDNFGRYPIIYVTFTDCGGASVHHIYDNIVDAISDAYYDHLYLENSSICAKEKFRNIFRGWHHMNELSFTRSLVELSEMLHDKFQEQVIVLVDEWDRPLTTALYQKSITQEEFEALYNNLQNLLTTLVKVKQTYIRKLIMISILGLTSVNPRESTMLFRHRFAQEEKYSTLFGFSLDEVQSLLSRHRVQIPIDELIFKFDGYTAPDKTKLYNPWSIMNSVWRRKVTPLWAQELRYDECFKLCLNLKIYPTMIELLDGGSYVAEDVRMTNRNQLKIFRQELQGVEVCNKNLVYVYLYELGILSIVNYNETSHTMKLEIPNEEIKREIRMALSNEKILKEHFSLPGDLATKVYRSFEKLTALDSASTDECFNNLAADISKLCSYIRHRNKDHEWDDLKDAKLMERNYEAVLYVLLKEHLSLWEMRDGINQKLSENPIRRQFTPLAKSGNESFPFARIDIIMKIATTTFILELKSRDSPSASKDALTNQVIKESRDQQYTYALNFPPFDESDQYFLCAINFFSDAHVQISYLCNSTDTSLAKTTKKILTPYFGYT